MVARHVGSRSCGAEERGRKVTDIAQNLEAEESASRAGERRKAAEAVILFSVL
jgi:hypothetical protein